VTFRESIEQHLIPGGGYGKNAHMNDFNAPPTTLSSEDLAAFQELRLRASGKLGSVPAGFIAAHVLSVTRGADWPVQRAALDALVRRKAFARRDDLRVATRPRGFLGLGEYRTRRRLDEIRPYRSLLASLKPFVGSCDCKDFSKSGLGMCKHLLVVLEDLAGKPSKWQRATEVEATQARRRSRLVWDPIRPLTGPGDWLDRIGWLEGSDGGSWHHPRPEVVDRWMTPNEDGILRLADGAPRDLGTRLDFVEGLLEVLDGQDGDHSAIGHDPALGPLLRTERETLRRRLEGSALCDRLSFTVSTLKHSLYPYQLEGLSEFLRSGRLLLADDMGLGKTVQAIAACHVMWRQGKVRRGLVIVPAPLKAQWAREWALFSDSPVRIVEGGPARRKADYADQESGFLIVNYEQVLRDLGVIHAWSPEMIVLDEAQRIKNWATKTAGYIKRLEPRYRLVLTGTPMENRLEELASIMDWVDEFALEPKWRLAPWHATLFDGRREASGARNLDTLRTRMAPVTKRRTRREVLDQLPSRTDTRVPVDLTDSQLSEHDELASPIARIMSRGKKRPLTQSEFLRLMQLLTTQRMICNGLAQVHFEEVWPTLESLSHGRRDVVLKSLDSPKLLELRELVRQLVVDGGQKVVVFSQWRRMLRLGAWATGDILEGAGFRSAFFSGEESRQRRTRNIIDFHDDPTLAVLFSTDAGGVGLNLQHAASTVINLELPWNPAVLEQRIGRVHRLGQKQPVQVFNLVGEQGIESRIADVVEDKQALFSGLFDGTSNEVCFSGTARFLDRVERLVEPVPVPDFPEPEEAIDEVVTTGFSEASGAPRTVADTSTGFQAPDVVSPSAASAAGRADSPVPDEPEVVDGATVRRFLETITVERTPDGGLKIEAPPETAGTLAAMFQGMADLLNGSVKSA